MVEDNEAGVDVQAAAGIIDRMRVRVPADSRVRLVQDHIVLPREQMRRGQSRDTRPHDRDLHAALSLMASALAYTRSGTAFKSHTSPSFESAHKQ